MVVGKFFALFILRVPLIIFFSTKVNPVLVNQPSSILFSIPSFILERRTWSPRTRRPKLSRFSLLLLILKKMASSCVWRLWIRLVLATSSTTNRGKWRVSKRKSVFISDLLCQLEAYSGWYWISVWRLSRAGKPREPSPHGRQPHSCLHLLYRTHRSCVSGCGNSCCCQIKNGLKSGDMIYIDWDPLTLNLCAAFTPASILSLWLPRRTP